MDGEQLLFGEDESVWKWSTLRWMLTAGLGDPESVSGLTAFYLYF